MNAENSQQSDYVYYLLRQFTNGDNISEINMQYVSRIARKARSGEMLEAQLLPKDFEDKMRNQLQAYESFVTDSVIEFINYTETKEYKKAVKRVINSTNNNYKDWHIINNAMAKEREYFQALEIGNNIIICRNFLQEKNYKAALIHFSDITEAIFRIMDSELSSKNLLIYKRQATKIKQASENPRNIEVWNFYKEQKNINPQKSDREIAIKFTLKNKKTSMSPASVRTYIRRGIKYSEKISLDMYMKGTLKSMGTDLSVFP